MTSFDLGTPLPLPTPSDELLRRLATRRSAPAQSLVGPGPDAAQLQEILTLGARTPDHGKLFPWRFVVLGPQSRARIADDLRALAIQKGLPDKARAVLAKLVNPPLSILVVSTAAPASKPVWEQELSAGAVCMNIEHAAGALGFASSWITDWYSYEPEATALFGLTGAEKVAGFIHIGSLSEPPLERERPDVAAITTILP
ncbi:nitroreductase [Brevundimonas vitis]|uniref:Putative NAD(P)H nitroreductase n=1 Tax=Brevundimonas vitisensis TaxID=2800818 RepID=A0ABX7BP39_9CAUL|nr:nitroreductase [Brevundimonas vitisensis]QQQ19011.1 nitroreductase [Brevundimonas vitisensis]